MTDMSDINNDRTGILSLSTIYEVITFHAAVVLRAEHMKYIVICIKW